MNTSPSRTADPLAYAEHQIRSYAYGRTDEDYAEIARRWVAKGIEASCAWHEVWEWAYKTRPYPPCDICGGPVDPRAKRHELCRLRRKRGVPTPFLDQTPECACFMCNPTAKPKPTPSHTPGGFRTRAPGSR